MRVENKQTEKTTLIIAEEVVFHRKSKNSHLNDIIAMVETERMKTSFYKHLKVFISIMIKTNFV